MLCVVLSMKRIAIASTLLLAGALSTLSATDSLNSSMMLGVTVSEPVAPPPPVALTPFEQHMERFRTLLVEFEYGSRRWSAYFTPMEHSILQGLGHVMLLADKVKGYGQNSLEGRESFRQLSVPLQHVSMNVRQSPVLRHVSHQWEEALTAYQDAVRAFTGENVSPTPGFDLNHPALKELQSSTKELAELSRILEHQIKSGLPITNIEAQGLVAYISQFSIYSNKLYTHSLSFVTERFQMGETMKKATEVSRQINAIMLYHPMPHLQHSWEFIRSKANTMKQQFEILMQGVPQQGVPQQGQ